MNYKELFEKYRLLLIENIRLAEENKQLKARLGITPSAPSGNHRERMPAENRLQDDTSIPHVTHTSESTFKIKLFMSLFKGRGDVYARRWENKKKGTSGYAPVCLNQWQVGLCGKPKASCADCANKLYAPLDEQVIGDHLRGNIVAGIYAMMPDETCCFLAMDFDDAHWQNDITTVRAVCNEFNLPVAVERSRSGNGGHVWFFFEDRVPAVLARRFGSGLLTLSMERRHDIHFKSYDRLFPSQDTMPKGGFGNLIALPFQKAARKSNNCEFVDENFESYSDQWAFLSSTQRISEGKMMDFVSALHSGHELGVLRIDQAEEMPKPWETHKVNLLKSDFPKRIEIVKANMLFVPKAGISQKALNRLKRLACFKNPVFYKKQALRLSTYATPRIITCADETTGYLCLPRGCEVDLKAELAPLGIDLTFIDKTNNGKRIDVEFNGRLRAEQSMALKHLLRHDTGILSGTTAFGKTVVAIKMIAERKVNTLILVGRVSLLNQWKEKLANFLTIDEAMAEIGDPTAKKGGARRKVGVIGQLGAGKSDLGGIVDVAITQSISRQGEVKGCVKNYGMIIADECHHAPAFNYEKILKATDAKYVYGLSATPTRKDGHHPILYMQCGPVRYRDDPRRQAQKRPFDHFIVPRFTSFRVFLEKDDQNISIQELYADIVENEFRNQQIVEDVLNNHKQGRNCLVLTQRTAHVELLANKLKQDVPDVEMLTGGLGTKTTREILNRIADAPLDKNLILVATGAFIGEGFDEPRLDTLFLAMPISWKGTLHQYAGRLHRLFENKKEVRIYDYADIHVKMLERMYQKRLGGYASMGYQAKGEDNMSSPLNVIFSNENFLPVLDNDIAAACREMLIVSPFVRKRRTMRMLQHLKAALDKKIRVIVVTRPITDFNVSYRKTLQEVFARLNGSEINVAFKSNIHQKFAVIDQKIVWYGSINLMSYGRAQESIMRIENPHIALELMKSVA